MDICIAKDEDNNLSPVLFFGVPKDSSATDEDDEEFPATGEDPPATKSAEGSLQSVQVSPPAPGSTKLVSLTIEGKNSNKTEDLKFQLWASMFNNIVMVAMDV